jgi:hypothetical protein
MEFQYATYFLRAGVLPSDPRISYIRSACQSGVANEGIVVELVAEDDASLRLIPDSTANNTM